MARRQKGEVLAVYVSPESGDEMVALDVAVFEPGMGIVGDRNHGGDTDPEDELTLIETEQVDHFNRETGLSIEPHDARRNVVTTGVSLNDLVGKRFRVGDALCEGMELCEPCKSLGEYLRSGAIGVPEVMEAFTHRAGLRARILEGGKIVSGAVVEELAD